MYYHKHVLSGESEFINAFVMSVKTDNAGTSTSTQFTIPTTGAGYSYDIEYDGNFLFGQTGDVTLEFGVAGTYDVKITGAFPRIFFNNGGDKLKALEVSQWGNISWTSFNTAFRGCLFLDVTADDYPDLSGVTDMQLMFFDCQLLQLLKPFAWDTSTVTNMFGVFGVCAIFNQQIFWDTSNVLNMASFLQSCTAYNQPVTFDLSSATTVNRMFYLCSNFNQSLSSLNTATVVDMTEMLRDATSFNQSISLNTAIVTTFLGMLRGATSFNSTITIDTGAVTNMVSMFFGATIFNQDISGFDIHLVTDMTTMLSGANAWSTANYDAALISFQGQVEKLNVPFHAGDATYTETAVDSGTTDGATTAFKLIQSGQNFITTVSVGDIIHNTTTEGFAKVTAIDSNTQLTLAQDIMLTGENYVVQSSAAAKARFELAITSNWTIIDGGAV